MSACLSNGCSVGIQPRNIARTRTVRCDHRVKTALGDVSGELIEVRDAGIVVFANQKLGSCPTRRSCRRRSIDRFRYAISKRTVPKPNVQAHLRLLSPLFPGSYAGFDATIVGHVRANRTGRREPMRYAFLLVAILRLRSCRDAGGRHSGSRIHRIRTLGNREIQDRAVAIADGYRQIGSDFPSMGEHWINIGLLFDGSSILRIPRFLLRGRVG